MVDFGPTGEESLTAVLEQVRDWPTELRVELARRILAPTPVKPAPRGISLEEFQAMFPVVPRELMEKDYKELLTDALCERYGV